MVMGSVVAVVVVRRSLFVRRSLLSSLPLSLPVVSPLPLSLPYDFRIALHYLTLSHRTLPTLRCRLVTCWLDAAYCCSLARPLLAAYSCLLAHFRREEARRLFLYMAKRKARGVSHGAALSE